MSLRGWGLPRYHRASMALDVGATPSRHEILGALRRGTLHDIGSEVGVDFIIRIRAYGLDELQPLVTTG